MEPPVRTIPLSEYAEELRVWLQMSRHRQVMNSYNQYLMIHSASQPCTILDGNSNITYNTSQQATSRQQALGAQQPAPTFPEAAGTRVTIPTVGKRVTAEVIDCIILNVAKFFITYLLVAYGGFKAVQIFDFDYAYLNGELDLEKFLNLSSEIVFIEMIHRLLVSFYEAFCLTYVTNIIPPGGFTPGKKFMGLAVVGCDEVFSLGNNRFIVIGMRNPSLYSTLTRSLVKNFSLSLMMPTCLTMFLYDHKRTVYDLMSGTVVIEVNA